MNWARSCLARSALISLRYLTVFAIAVYQRLLSPLFPPCCRFYPSCSAYARQAVEKHGLLKGGVLALVRVCKCHPFHPGGYDPLI